MYILQFGKLHKNHIMLTKINRSPKFAQPIKTAVKQENITLIALTHIQKACND